MVVSTLAPRPDDPYRIFPAAHSWNSTYEITYEFLTDIITSRSGKEQRRAVREYPRVSIKGESTYWGEQKLLMDYFFHGWQPFGAIAPLEDRAMHTADYMSPEDQTVKLRTVDGAVPDWIQPGLVIIRHGTRPGVMETRTLSGIAGDQALFSDYSLTEFPPGSWIMPAIHGWAGVDPSAPRRSNRVGTYSFSFVGDPAQQPPMIEGGEPVFLAGKEVFEKRPNWRDALAVDFGWNRTPIDYKYGVIGNPVEKDFASRVTKATYLARNRQEIGEVVNFFVRCQGRRQDFFVPTYEDDIPFTAISGGGRAILVAGVAFARIYADSTVFRRIALRLRDGSLSHHLVDYVEELPSGESVLWVTDQLPISQLTPDTVRGISWVLNSRFAADSLTVSYRSNTTGEFSLAFQSLENFEL